MFAPPECAMVCQACYNTTARRCSVCSVCIFCSEECERTADEFCNARIACAQHAKCAHEDYKGTRLPFRMHPLFPLSKVPAHYKGTQWQTLVLGATHNLEYLIASSSQNLSKKTIFGMSVVVTDDGKFCAASQRLNFELKGTQSEAVTENVRNMSQFALAQLQMTHATFPPNKARVTKKKQAHKNSNNPNNPNNGKHAQFSHRDYADGVSNQACIVSGIVVNEGVHFDAIFLVRKGDAWTVHGVQPLYLQFHEANGTTPAGDKSYRMDYKPNGVAPLKPRHSRALIEGALALEPTPAPAPQMPEPPAPSSQAPPASGEPPHLRLPPAMTEEARPLRPLPPHLAQALAEAEASQAAPAWTSQLQRALQEGLD